MAFISVGLVPQHTFLTPVTNVRTPVSVCRIHHNTTPSGFVHLEVAFSFRLLVFQDKMQKRWCVS